MKGLYNGVTMKLRYLYPYNRLKRIVGLSLQAQRRLAWFDFYQGHGRNARLTCRHFCISPDTFYRWKRRFNPRYLKTLEEDESRHRPRRLRTMTTSPTVLRRITEIRLADREKSKYEIAAELRREGVRVGTSTIQKVINRNPQLLNTQHHRRVSSRRKLSIARLKAARELRERFPGSLVQIDTKHLFILRRRFYLFCALDCRSRWGYVSAFKSSTSQAAQAFLREVLAFLPFKIEALQTDNGSEYLGQFHEECQKLGLIHYFTDPQCPKQNGRVERFIQTATYEFFNYQDDLLDELEMVRARCQLFNHKYNYCRLHQKLGYKTPTEYLEEIAECVSVVSSQVYGV